MLRFYSPTNSRLLHARSGCFISCANGWQEVNPPAIRAANSFALHCNNLQTYQMIKISFRPRRFCAILISALLGRFGGVVHPMAEIRVQEGEPLENALRRFKRKVQTEDIIKEVKRHSFYLKPGEKKRVKEALARKRNRKKIRKEQD